MISILIATYGDSEWETRGRALADATAAHQPCMTISYHEPNGTIASCRNEAARSAPTDWICFLDADDQLDPLFTPWMLRSISRHPVNYKTLYTPIVQQVRGGKKIKPFFYPECSLETGNWLIIGTLISKRLFDEVGGFHEHPHGLEDWNLWARCVRAGAEIVKVKRAIYIAHFNRHSKHHELARDRNGYRAAYEKARLDAWG